MSSKVQDIRIVNVTCPDVETARKIGRLAVDRRLVACVNIFPGVQSIYRWMGEVCEDDEVFVSMKTREEFVELLFTAIVANHPYPQPAIEVLAVDSVGRGVAAWIKAETGGEATVSLPKGFKGAED